MKVIEGILKWYEEEERKEEEKIGLFTSLIVEVCTWMEWKRKGRAFFKVGYIILLLVCMI